MSIEPKYPALGKRDYSASDLEMIERKATWARNDAIAAYGAVRLLRVQPGFETKAMEALKLSEVELETALDAVRKAITEFADKPVTA